MITKFKIFEKINEITKDRGTASGFMLTHNILVTASHCILQAFDDKGNNDIRINFIDKSEIQTQTNAELLRYDLSADLAFLKLKKKFNVDIPYSLAIDEDIKVGQRIYAYGHTLYGQLPLEPVFLEGNIVSIDNFGVITTSLVGFGGSSGMLVLNENCQIIGFISAGHVNNLFTIVMPVGAIQHLLDALKIDFNNNKKPLKTLDNIEIIKKCVCLVDVPNPIYDPKEFMDELVNIFSENEKEKNK